MFLKFLAPLPILLLMPLAAAPGYLGAAVCAQCHRAIGAAQAKTNMALTWQSAAPALPAAFDEARPESPAPDIGYRIRRARNGFLYSVQMPDRSEFRAPVESIVGGRRHGLSFLVRVPKIEDAPLVRAPLIETRYLHGIHENALVLSPGFPAEKPSSYEAALGRVLTPDFERKCLACHGQPESGVHCESCHGPGQAHLQSVAQNKPRNGILNPGRLPPAQAIEKCAQCHAGFSELSDPVPDDLLISSQVNALKNTECYIQSGQALGCTNCHDPHQDSPGVEAKSIAACLSCHSESAKLRAGLCPVNRKEQCLGCHMPVVRKGSFEMVDHWIRVHPEQRARAGLAEPALRTRVRPKREFLRIIVMDSAAKAAAVRERLGKGEPFFALAAENSLDSSAPGGGYIGEMWLDQMDSKLAQAAATLTPGDISPVVESPPKYILLQRAERDFRWQAEQLQLEASALKAKGQLAASIDKYQEALRIYPHFLRALIFLGAAVGEQGDAGRAAGVLQFAAQLYPKDPAAQYNLGIAYGALGKTLEEIQAYRKAVDLEPGLLPAYQNLGAALLSAGQTEAAAAAYRRGLEQDPLSAILYYNLAVVREQQGDAAEAKRYMELARKIDPEFVASQNRNPNKARP